MAGHAAFIDGSLAIAVFGATHLYPTVDAAVQGLLIHPPGWPARGGATVRW